MYQTALTPDYTLDYVAGVGSQLLYKQVPVSIRWIDDAMQLEAMMELHKQVRRCREFLTNIDQLVNNPNLTYADRITRIQSQLDTYKQISYTGVMTGKEAAIVLLQELNRRKGATPSPIASRVSEAAQRLAQEYGIPKVALPESLVQAE
jgi:hypothetical protein